MALFVGTCPGGLWSGLINEIAAFPNSSVGPKIDGAAVDKK